MEFDKSTLEAIGKKMIRKKQTLAVAESVTSGLLQYAISQIPDASLFFQGGITAYNLGQKFKHLNVEPIHAQACDCVSQQVAAQLALEVAKKFRSDWGISITGYSTPVPESGNRLFCYYAIVYHDKIKSKGKITGKEKDPSLVQLQYAEAVLSKLKILL